LRPETTRHMKNCISDAMKWVIPENIHTIPWLAS